MASGGKNMHWIIRGILLLWAAFFGYLGLTGLANPAVFTETFGVTGDASALNTVRADFAAFFIVSGACAAWGALRPEHARILLVPAMLFGAALIGRAVGVSLGDPLSDGVKQSMIVEALSVALLLGSARWLARFHVSNGR